MVQTTSKHVFISYSRKDNDAMRRIVQYLREQGIRAWVDNEFLTPGTRVWEREIEKAIIESFAVVVVLSPDAKNSEWVLREITLADEYQKQVFPIIVAGLNRESTPFRLLNRQYADMRQSEPHGLKSLSDAVFSYWNLFLRIEEEERKAAEQVARHKAEEEQLANAKLEAEKKAQEEADRIAQQKTEQEKLARAKLEADRIAREKAEEEKLVTAKFEAERMAAEKKRARESEEAERRKKLEAEQKSAKNVLIRSTNGAPSLQAAAGRSTLPTDRQQIFTSRWFAYGAIGAAIIVLALCGYAAFSILPGLFAGTTPTITATSPEQTPSRVSTNSVTAEPTVFVLQHGTLRVSSQTFPDTIDPQKASFLVETGHLNLIYEGLTKYNENLETVPAAAETWEYNDSATALVFTLRHGLTYSDGSTLNAERFAYSIKRAIDPATASESAYLLEGILGASEWIGGGDAQTLNESVKASHADGSTCSGYEDTDCNTLTLILSRSMPYFHSIMALWVVYPAKEENIQAGGETWWQSPKYQIGNGAWILEDFNQNTGSVYSSNPNYYSGEPNYDIQIKYIEDSVVAFEAYKNNELDVIASAAETLSEIENDPDLTSQHLTYAGSCTFGIKFNLHPTRLGVENPFSDKKVREAFALAFDTESWIREVDSGLSFAASTWIPPGFPGHDSTASPTFDVEAARAALAESSYGGPDALNALGLKLTFGDSARNRQRFEWLVANYKSNLGIDLALDPVESTTFSGMLRNSDQYPLLNRAGWCVDIPDPQDWLSSWRSGSSLTRPQGYNNPNFDALLDAADTELDPAQRAELYRQAQQTMISDIPMALAYHTLQHFLVKPWVKGIQTTPKDLMFPGDINATSISIDVASIP